jgi:hypothetical protein
MGFTGAGVESVEDVAVDTGGQLPSPEARCIPEAALWADGDTWATSGSFGAGVVDMGFFFLAVDVVLRTIKVSIEKSDREQKKREK